MKERAALLAAFTEAVWARQTHEFGWLVKAAYSAGANREDLLLAVETGRLMGDPPEAVATEAYITVDAWQWMASRGTARRDESTPSSERRRTERMKTWLPCTMK